MQKSAEGLSLKDNLLVGAPVLITTESSIAQSGNQAHDKLPAQAKGGAGQRTWTQAQVNEIAAWKPAQASAELVATGTASAPAATKLSPEVLEHMRKVHAGFKGQKGYVAQFGDSITYSMAFWSVMSWADPTPFLPDDGLPKAPAKASWKNTVKGARDKGQKFANYSGWKVGNLLKSIDAVLAHDKPEAALIMIGTNDISGGKVPDGYRAGLEEVIAKCIATNCVPILNTIPPRRDRENAVAEANTIIREVAAAKKIPLADFHAACLRVRPGKTWDGTVISKDGVHPSGGKSNNYGGANLKICGYALRNWVNFLTYRQVYFGVFEAK